jgi:hypothetical protein
MFAVIKPWTTKPTLYKKFINDLYLGINKWTYKNKYQEYNQWWD